MVARGRGIPPGRQLITWCCFAGRRAAVAVCPPRRGCQPPVPPPPLPPPPPPDAVPAIARSPPLIRVGSLRRWQRLDSPERLPAVLQRPLHGGEYRLPRGV